MKFVLTRFSVSALFASLVLLLQSCAKAAQPGSGFIDVSGGKLYYESEGNGPDMVLLHDGMMHSESWDAQRDFFAKQYRVVRYDRRGYGKSSAASASYSEVEDLRTLFERLKLTNAIVIGCSAGGGLAIDFTLDQPQWVRRLIVAGSIVSGFGFSEHFDARVRTGFEPLRNRGDVAGSISNWLADPFLIAPANNAARDRFRSLMEANPQNFTRPNQFAKGPVQPALARLREIKIPALIIVGESDIPDVHAHCGAIQAGIPVSRRVVVSGAGHFVHVEKPDEFNQLVARFLAGSGKPGDLVYSVPKMESVTVRSNLTYKSIDESQKLAADVYFPANLSLEERRPAIIFVLGDADAATLRDAKNWPFLQSYGRVAAASGYVGVTFDHRSSEGFSKLPEVRSDIVDLMAYLRKNAAELQIAPDKLCLWFFSGSSLHLEAGFGDGTNAVRCIVAYYPLLAPFPGAAPENVRNQFSALEQIKRHAPRVPPLLIAKAGRDDRFLNDLIDQFRSEGKLIGVPLEYLEHPTGDHAFDIRNEDNVSREIIERTLKFVAGKLGH